MLRQRRQTGPAAVKSSVGPPGIALVLAILLVGLLLVMGLTMINLASSDHKVASNESKSIQALYNADAGSEEAKMRLSPTAPAAMKIPVGTVADWRAYISTDPDCAGQSQATLKSRIAALDPTYALAPSGYTSAEATTNYTVYCTVQGTGGIQWGWLRIQHKFSGSSIVYLDVVTGSETTAPSQAVSGQTVYNQPVQVVTSEGIQATVRRMISMELRPIVATTTATKTVVTDPFSNAAHGKDSVSIQGNVATDSYDSRKGAYDASKNKGSEGDVSTDATTAGAINVGSNATINGDAYIGPGGNVSSGIQSSGTITGTLGTEGSTWDMPLSLIPTGVTNSGALSLAGKSTRTLTEGTYWFSSISITGNGQLNIVGNVKIYVTGSIDAGGNGFVNVNTPPSLLIYGTVDPTNPANKCTSVSIHGNGVFSGAVYAPAANIDVVGNGEVYGALTGKTAKFTGSGMGGFHYDEALGKIGEFVTETPTTTVSNSGYSRFSWREIPF